MAPWATQNWDFGGAVSYGVNSVTASPLAGRVVTFHGTDAARTVAMPDARHWCSGMLFTVVANTQTTNAVRVEDIDGTLIVNVPASRVGRIWLMSNATRAGSWFSNVDVIQ